MKKYVLYWMQQSQRLRYNKAYNYAVSRADELKLPLLVCFVVSPYPEAQKAHYHFMLTGIKKTIDDLVDNKTGTVIRQGNMVEEVVRLAGAAEVLVIDQGYLDIQRKWRNQVIELVDSETKVIDTDTVIPVTITSDKPEIAARTLRPRIKRNLEDYELEVFLKTPQIDSSQHQLVKENEPVKDSIFKKYLLPGSQYFYSLNGGATAAQSLLSGFIDDKLPYYHTLSNDPSKEIRSCLSPYLHFGQISALDITLQIRHAHAPQPAIDSFLEQLIVRRELAVNFVWYTEDYQSYNAAVPLWAQKTLNDHAQDRREYLYKLSQLEKAETHDIYWNAAQMELIKTGHMHNYMRMYWGKKIIEWTKFPQQAFEWMQYINNFYQLDGRDANSYAGIAWCFGLHDHPWKERQIFGKVRYMNEKGLKRKFLIDDYARKWL